MSEVAERDVIHMNCGKAAIAPGITPQTIVDIVNRGARVLCFSCRREFRGLMQAFDDEGRWRAYS